MVIDRATAQKYFRDIRDALNREWDPIGGCPEDEYESYAEPLATMLHSGATDEMLLKHLEWAEVEDMGLGAPFDIERAHKTISALRALRKP